MTAGPDLAALASPPPPPGADGEALLDAWRDARDDALAAYRAWCAASRYRADEAFAVFTAAQDREAAAGDALARLVSRIRPSGSSLLSPGMPETRKDIR